MGGEGEWPSLCIIDGRGGGSGHPCVPSGMWHQTHMTKVLAFAVQSLLTQQSTSVGDVQCIQLCYGYVLYMRTYILALTFSECATCKYKHLILFKSRVL